MSVTLMLIGLASGALVVPAVAADSSAVAKDFEDFSGVAVCREIGKSAELIATSRDRGIPIENIRQELANAQLSQPAMIQWEGDIIADIYDTPNMTPSAARRYFSNTCLLGLGDKD
jgi:hypothetical protein